MQAVLLHRCRSLERQSCSHSCFCASWQYTAKVVDVHVVQLHRCSSWIDGLTFLGRVHRYTARGFPRHQDGEGVAGTPGACSQVFCHPIRCISLAHMDRHIRQTHRHHHHHHHPPEPRPHPHPDTRTHTHCHFFLFLRFRKFQEFRRFKKSKFFVAVLWHSKMAVAAALHHSSGPRASGPVYDQVHQEQFGAGEMLVGIPVAQEQVIVQAIPRVVGSLPPVEGFTGPVFAQVHQEQLSASEMTVDIAEIPVVHQQVIAGMRPERVVVARGAHGGLERVRHSAVEPPIPCCVVSVHQPEAHDNTTTRYLLKKALQRKKEEEAEKKEEVDVLLDIPLQLRTPAQRARLFELISASSQARRRKRKKRRKRRLPRTSSRLSRCRKLWRFRSCSSFTLSSTSPFVPQRQILMVQTLQQTTEYPQLLFVSGGRCSCCAGRACHAVSTALMCSWLVFLVTLHLALCFCVFAWPMMLRIMAGTHHAVAGFTGYDAPRAVLLFFVVRPMILGIMASSRTAENCGFYAVAVHCWSSTFFVPQRQFLMV